MQSCIPLKEKITLVINFMHQPDWAMGSQVFGPIWFWACLWWYFWKILTSESMGWKKQMVCLNVGGPYPISCRKPKGRMRGDCSCQTAWDETLSFSGLQTWTELWLFWGSPALQLLNRSSLYPLSWVSSLQTVDLQGFLSLYSPQPIPNNTLWIPFHCRAWTNTYLDETPVSDRLAEEVLQATCPVENHENPKWKQMSKCLWNASPSKLVQT